MSLVVALLLMPCTRAIAQEHDTSTTGRPNIVFVLVDDLGIGQVGAYRATKVPTPRLDELAGEGVRFTSAYAGSSVCSPSRIGLYTGRDPRMQRRNDNSALLTKADLTLPRLLQQAGYETNLIGKWGLGLTIGENDPMTHGFDQWFGYLSNVQAHRHYPKVLYENNERVVLPKNQGNQRETLAHDLFTERALDYIRGPHEKPFFLMLAYTFPHAELAAPADTYERYKSAFEEVPYEGRASNLQENRRNYPAPVARPRAVLAGMVAAIDRDIGRLVSALREADLEDDTIFIFSSDNGPHHAGGADPAFFEAAAPFRGIKRDLYDGGIRVPMIVRWPGHIRPGRVDDTPWAFWDFLPTLTEAADMDLESVEGLRTNGISMLSVWTDAADIPERDLYWELRVLLGDGSARDFRQALRRGRWKAVRYGTDSPVEIYDITRDPGEMHDLATEQPGLASDVREIFDAQTAVRRKRVQTDKPGGS